MSTSEGTVKLLKTVLHPCMYRKHNLVTNIMHLRDTGIEHLKPTGKGYCCHLFAKFYLNNFENEESGNELQDKSTYQEKETEQDRI